MKSRGIKSLFNSMLAFFIIVGAALQAVFFYQLLYMSSYQEQKFGNAIVNQVQVTVEKRIEATQSIASRLSGNALVSGFLTAQDAAQKQALLTQCTEYLGTLQNGSEEMLYAVLVDNAQNSYKLTNNISDMEYEKVRSVYRDYLEAVHNNPQGMDGTYCDFFDYGVANPTELYACSVQPVYVHDYEQLVNVEQGVIVVCTKINVKKLLLGVADLFEMDVTITNNYSGRQTRISLKEINSESLYQKNLQQTVPISNTSWELVGTFNVDRTEYTIRNQQLLFLLEIVLILAFIIFLRRVIATKIVRPVSEIVQFLNEYEITSRTKHIQVQSVGEIQVIAHYINRLLDNTKRMTRKLIQKQQQLYEVELLNRQNQLYALQNQVNPHFLYNVLECIRGMALMRDMGDVAEMAASVSNIMRYTLSDRQTVSLREELDICLQYTGIMQLRYPGGFTVQTEVPEQLLDCAVLKMTLQPIVENAFNHGRFFRKKNGVLYISAQQEGDYLKVRIVDNGKGIDAARLRQITGQLAQDDAVYHADGSIGLTNINSRVRLQGGGRCGLEIDSQLDHFTAVTVRYRLQKM